MSMIDKQILLKDLETALGDIVTANERDRVLEAVGEALQDYDVIIREDLFPKEGKDED